MSNGCSRPGVWAPSAISVRGETERMSREGAEGCFELRHNGEEIFVRVYLFCFGWVDCILVAVEPIAYASDVLLGYSWPGTKCGVLQH
jgi:hypothetical protein